MVIFKFENLVQFFVSDIFNRFAKDDLINSILAVTDKTKFD